MAKICMCSEGVSADKSKIDSMLSWPQPTTVKGLRGFLASPGMKKQQGLSVKDWVNTNQTLLYKKMARKSVFTIHPSLPNYLTVKSNGKRQLRDRKGNSGVKVHDGREKRHSWIPIGQNPLDVTYGQVRKHKENGHLH
ncbi:hypothetical protein Tco_1086640 [Tanacetum coccineum]